MFESCRPDRRTGQSNLSGFWFLETGCTGRLGDLVFRIHIHNRLCDVSELRDWNMLDAVDDNDVPA